MIIGISGKKQHGKDTVAKMINYFVAGIDKLMPIEAFLEHYEDSFRDGSNYPFKNVKYADKLKDIICMLIDCTREQLEDDTFKDTPLGEEWNIWRGTLPDKKGRVRHIIFDSAQEAKFELDKMNENGGVTEYMSIYMNRLTPRLLLQLLGTECGRKIIHPNIWVNATMSNYKPFKKREEAIWDGNLGRYTIPSTHPANKEGKTIQLNTRWFEYSIDPDWTITDVRFPNEITAIEDRGGVVVRVNNPRVKSEDTHESETALDNYPFKDIIINDDTLDTLAVQVHTYLRYINVLK